MEGLGFLLDIRFASFIIGILFPVFLYWYSTKNFNYWKNRGIPFSKAYPVVGSFWEAFNKNLEDVEIARYNKFGRIYGVFEGDRPMIVVGEPELVRNILVKDFHHFSTRRDIDIGEPLWDNMLSLMNGEAWKRVRTIITPTFSTGKMKRLISIFQDCSRTVAANVKQAKDRNYIIDILKTYGAFSIDVIASSAFSTKIDTHKDPNNDFVKNAKAAFAQKPGVRMVLLMFMPRLLKLLRISVFDPKNMYFFRDVILEIIKERKRTGQTRNDFLQLLLDAANNEAIIEEKSDDKTEDILANYGDDNASQQIFKTPTSKTLSMDELIANSVIFFVAGYHTTATTMALTHYFLALNQEVQNKAFKEITEVLQETNGELTYEAIQKMKYLDNVISETLRIYSPAVRLDRTCVSDYELGDTGITIPKGMVVGIPNFAMHRDPKLFPEPEKFDPDRFSPEERDKQIPFSYLPFGAGPRNCVGMRFALLEMKVGLIHVISAFHAKPCSETKIPMEFGQAAGIILPKAVVLQMEPRVNCPLKS